MAAVGEEARTGSKPPPTTSRRPKLSSEKPEDYMNNPNQDVVTNIEDIYNRMDRVVAAKEWEMYEAMVYDLLEARPMTEKDFSKAIVTLRQKYKRIPKKSELMFVYNALMAKGDVEPHEPLLGLLVKKSSKSQSGVLVRVESVITVLTSPYPEYDGKVQKFSCKWNCHYCPNEPGQPRSYLHDEPAVLRANQNGFDPVLQFTDRAATLAVNGHPVDKIEILVLGGTWASYPHSYQEGFCRDLFYAANTFHEREKRPRLALEEEQRRNEAAACKVIGLTLETRPDTITPDEIRRLRRYGCTRVQLGVQHSDDAILTKINRGCTNEDTIRALRLLKDTCYKIDIHLMPNLPGASAEIDTAMFNRVLSDPDLQADQWKIYPCEVVPWTQVKKWFEEGSFVPYSDEELWEVLIATKAKVHPWIRLNRVIRDIPSQYILGGVDAPNLRQALLAEMGKRGLACNCLRCREVGTESHLVESAELVERRRALQRSLLYEASGGEEIFLSFETRDRRTVFGFCRLRLSQDPGAGVYESLRGAALVRELHVYGQLIPTLDPSGTAAQHVGFGRALMARAEEIAAQAGFTAVAVISGIGARNYYRKIGYEMVEGDFMRKPIGAPIAAVAAQGAGEGGEAAGAPQPAEPQQAAAGGAGRGEAADRGSGEQTEGPSASSSQLSEERAALKPVALRRSGGGGGGASTSGAQQQGVATSAGGAARRAAEAARRYYSQFRRERPKAAKAATVAAAAGSAAVLLGLWRRSGGAGGGGGGTAGGGSGGGNGAVAVAATARVLRKGGGT